MGESSDFKNIGEFLLKRCIETPSKIAIEMEVDNQWVKIDYQTFYSKAALLARKLLKKAKPGDRALLIYMPSIDFMVAFFACCISGIIAVPCFPPVNSIFSKKLALIIKDCSPALLLTTRSLYWKFLAGKSLAWMAPLIKVLPIPYAKNIDQDFFAELNPFNLMTTDNIEVENNAPELSHTLSSVEPNDIAFLQYTSGTTSTTKGVMVSHKNILTNVRELIQHFGFSQKTKSVFWEPHYHDMGLIAGIIMPIYGGFLVRSMSPFDLIKSPLKWLQNISDIKADVSGGPTFAYHLCLKLSDEEIEHLDLSDWTCAFCGAEPIRSDILRKFAEKFEKCNFNRHSFSSCYGLAESTLFVVAKTHFSMDEVIAFDRRKLFHESRAQPTSEKGEGIEIVSCGTGPSTQDIKIIDPTTHAMLKESQVGKIVVQSDSVALGYWNKGEAINKAFHLLLENGKEYCDTGDLGFILKGELFITGRLKEILIIHGINYNPEPIEHVIEGISPNIRAGGVVAIQVQGEDLDSITIVAEFKTPEIDDLRTLCQRIREEVLKQFTLDVRKIYCVKPKFIPKTTSGKLSRVKLQDDLESKDGIIFISDLIHSGNLGGASDNKETVFLDVAKLAEQLNLGTIHIQDPFHGTFDNSLNQMQLLVQLELSLGCENLPYSLLSQTKTFSELIEKALEWKKVHSVKKEESIVRTTSSDLSVPPMAKMILRQMGAKEFNLAYVCDLLNPISFDELKEALKDLIKIQPYLNSYYSEEKNHFISNGELDLEAVLERKEVSLPENEVKSFIEACIKEASLALNIYRPPMFKAILIENSLTKKRHLVFITSHLIADPYSLWLWFEQLDMLIKKPKGHLVQLQNNVMNELSIVHQVFPHSNLQREIQPSHKTKESEEVVLKYEINKQAVDKLQAYAKKLNMDSDILWMGLSSLALKMNNFNTDLLQFVHNGRTLIHSDRPISNLIGWLNMSWPIVLPDWQGSFTGYLKNLNASLEKSKKEAVKYTLKSMYGAENLDNHIDPLQAELEYSDVRMQRFRTTHGSFATSALFAEDYLHGDTFAKKLPRYRKIFIRPLIRDRAVDLMFFAEKDAVDLAGVDNSLSEITRKLSL